MAIIRDPAANRMQRVIKPVGPTCAWCLNHAAGSFTMEAGQVRLPPYHADCDCTYDIIAIGAEPPDWLTGILAVIAAARLAARSDDEASHDDLYYIRRLYPDLVTDGVYQRAPSFKWDGPVPTWDTPHPPPEPEPGDGPYWLARQNATGIEANGETLKPREVLFVERMIALGYSIEWIPQNRDRTPSSDFTWRGERFELKSTGATIGAIAGAIKDDTKKGKDRFVIDLGTASIPPDLIDLLASYNVKHLRSIRELWLMSNGQLLQVPLTEI